MNDFFKNIYDEFLKIWNPLNISQKILISVLTLVLIIGFIFLMNWIRQPQYVVLYSNLDTENAGEIVEKLKDQNIDYKLTKGGTTIEVPNSKVYDLRLQLAKDGLPHKGEIGYELFDTNKLGMSDFMQKISYRRALEGELMRTIQKMEEIESARLHIVIPEPSLFKEDALESTASIVIKLKLQTVLSKNQVRGICYLVAGSVEGLKAENVTIIDTFGNILSDQTKHDSIVGLTASQLDIKKKIDSYLAVKVQTLFDQVLGPGNSVIRIDADLDFKQVNKTTESYDPENTSVRSEEIISETSTTANNQPNETEHTTTNYEVNKTIENVLESAGTVKRLSVAILVNGIQQKITNDAGEEQVTIVPRSQEELDQLASIAKNAVGFYEERNDQITINNFTFDSSRFDQEKDALEKYEQKQFIMSIIYKAVMGLIVLIFLLYVRSMIKKVVPKKRKKEVHPELESEEMDVLEEEIDDEEMKSISEEIPAETKKMKQQQERIKEFSEEQPQEVFRLIRTWLDEDTRTK